MIDCCADDGKIVATFPLGFNPILDDIVFDNDIFDIHLMRRQHHHLWVEVNSQSLPKDRHIEAVVIMMIGKGTL